MSEEWKDIEDYNGRYQISNFGNIRSTDRYYKQANNKIEECDHFYKGKILKPQITNCGYKRIGLSKNGKVKLHTIHKLVAQAFIPNINNLPCINHIDGNKLNNNVNNLEWCSYSYNNKHARLTGLNKGKSYKVRVRKAIEYIENNSASLPMGRDEFTCEMRYSDPVVLAHDILDILRGEE